MTAPLDDLIARVEAAEGPDRELDADLHNLNARYGGKREWTNGNKEWITWWHYKDHEDSGSSRSTFVVPHYTGSLDAAMTLVAASHWARVQTVTRGTLPLAWCSNDHEEDAAEACEGATPALALCAAALRARRAALTANDGDRE